MAAAAPRKPASVTKAPGTPAAARPRAAKAPSATQASSGIVAAIAERVELPLKAKRVGPYVPANKVFPEFTARALILGVILSVVLGAANMYVGLKAGLTVSATIPAAVISMAVLRNMKNGNILENAIAMTTASAGEALGAGLIFTVPSLIVLGIWSDIHLLETILLGLVGGTLGVLFTVPLRRALIVEAKLPYPEGIATAQVLVTGEQGTGVKILGAGMLLGAATALAGTGLQLWNGAVQGATRIGNTVAYIGTAVTPILLAVGYIVGLRIASLIFIGGVLGFLVFAPAFLALGIFDPLKVPALGTVDVQTTLLAVWATKVRLVGAGAMITGGIFTLYKIRTSLKSAVAEGAAGFKNRGSTDDRIRTDQDLRFDRVLAGIALLAIPIFAVGYLLTNNLLFAGVALVCAVVAGFFFSAVAGYLAGVVGSSNNPISGVTIVTLLFTSAVLLGLGATGTTGILAAVSVGALICTGAAIAGDNLQDLKTGYLVGSTPKYQQLALIFGVVAMAIAGPVVLNVIQGTVGLGSTAFPAPQAFVVATLVQSIFGGTADVPMLALGALVGAALIAAKLPVLPVAVGIYLPMTLSTPIFIGGVLAWATGKVADRQAGQRGLTAAETKQHKQAATATGVLLSSGLIAGEALMGITVIFLFAAYGHIETIPGYILAAIAALLGASAGLVLMEPGKARTTVVGGSILLGIVVAALYATGALVYAPLSGTAALPGLLIFGYISLLMVYLPLRNLLLGKPADEVPGVGLEE